ncbi:MAG: hypothetical protein AB7S75_19005 [Desulfococcaceae bacterium]
MPAVSANQIILDENALSLYEQLDGIHTEYQGTVNEKLLSEDKESDALRLDMMETAHFISSYFLDNRFSEGIKNRKDCFGDILRMLEKLAANPGHDRKIIIRYRGYPTGTAVSAEHDYVIAFGRLTADAAAAAVLKSRLGTDKSHLPARLGKAFQTLSEHGISNLCVKIPQNSEGFSPEQSEHLRDCLNIISRFNRALQTSSPIVLDKKGQKTLLPVICDEKGAGDFNLTLLAGINSIPPRNMQMLVHKSGSWIKAAEESGKANPYISAYEAIINAGNLKDRLIIPPVEVNNLKWLCLDDRQIIIRPEQARVSRTAADLFKSAPQNAVQLIQTVYGNDYKEISAGHLGKRLQAATDFLGEVEKQTGQTEIEGEVLHSISERFEELRDEVFDDIIIQKNILKIRSAHSEPVAVENINAKLRQILTFYKGRSIANRKVKNIIGKGIDFDMQDYEALARDFSISATDVKSVIELLRSCFSKDGHFLRSVFESHIPAFARYEKKIFRFLWHYLKETPSRNDRVAFLNSMQMLIARMHQPEHALRMLLADVLDKADTVSFSDRNALMLANLLIREYYKELNSDIEMTPEEILQAKNGLNPEAIRAAGEIVSARQEDIFCKIRSINRELMTAAASDEAEEKKMSIRFLLAMERELHIFLILTGGETACRVLRNAVSRYGDPQADIYLSMEIRNRMESVIQHLTVVIRGLDRIGEKRDIRLLLHLRQEEGRFLAIPMDSRCISKIRRLMQWVETARKNIENRNPGVSSALK